MLQDLGQLVGSATGTRSRRGQVGVAHAEDEGVGVRADEERDRRLRGGGVEVGASGTRPRGGSGRSTRATVPPGSTTRSTRFTTSGSMTSRSAPRASNRSPRVVAEVEHLGGAEPQPGKAGELAVVAGDDEAYVDVGELARDVVREACRRDVDDDRADRAEGDVELGVDIGERDQREHDLVGRAVRCGSGRRQLARRSRLDLGPGARRKPSAVETTKADLVTAVRVARVRESGATATMRSTSRTGGGRAAQMHGPAGRTPSRPPPVDSFLDPWFLVSASSNAVGDDGPRSCACYRPVASVYGLTCGSCSQGVRCRASEELRLADRERERGVQPAPARPRRGSESVETSRVGGRRDVDHGVLVRRGRASRPGGGRYAPMRNPSVVASPLMVRLTRASRTSTRSRPPHHGASRRHVGGELPGPRARAWPRPPGPTWRPGRRAGSRARGRRRPCARLEQVLEHLRRDVVEQDVGRRDVGERAPRAGRAPRPRPSCSRRRGGRRGRRS